MDHTSLPPMNPLREVAQVFPLPTFFLMACIFSWALWGLMMASARGLLPFPFPLNPAGSFGPAVAGLLVAACHPGEVRALLKSLLRWRMRWTWYAGALLVPGVLWGLGLLLYLLLGGSVPRPSTWSGLPWIPAYFLLILLLGGPLGEEPGWRGVALPRLLSRMNPLAASAVLAAMWLLWHLPLFWLEGSSQSGGSIPYFAGAVCAFAVLFTWVYVRTGGNLFAAVLFHAGINTTSYVTGALFPALDADKSFSGAHLWVLGAAVLGLVIWDRKLLLERVPAPATA